MLFYTTAARVSDFIQQTEVPTALARSDAMQCAMIWVPLERNDLAANHPLEQRLKKLQCATRDARPVYDFEIVQKGSRRSAAPSTRAASSCVDAPQLGRIGKSGRINSHSWRSGWIASQTYPPACGSNAFRA